MEELSKTSSLSSEHKEYLVNKHGTHLLDPLPSQHDDDPLNWSYKFKLLQVSMISFHAFSTTFMAAGTIPAFAEFAIKFGNSVTANSYLTSCQIIILGIFPMIWILIMNKYGRYELLLLSTLGSTAFNIGCVFSKNYGQLMVCRIFQAVMISPGISVGANIVKELTFSHQRGWWTGWWVISVTLGTHMGPFLMGFVVYQLNDTKYIFVIFTVMNALQFLAYLLFGKETIYDRTVNLEHQRKLFLVFQTKTNSALSWLKFFKPLYFVTDVKVFLASLAYAVTFTYSNVACGVELTSLFTENFAFNPQQIGLQFISFILGCLLGEQVGGWMSDLWMRKNKRPGYAERRLWLSYAGFVLSIVGLIIYGVQLSKITKWNITPLIGLCLTSIGLQIVTTILVTYCIDLHPPLASDVAIFITMVRQIFAFVGPFYFPVMLEQIGIKKTYGVLAGLVAAVGLVPIAMIHSFLSTKKVKLTKEVD